MTTDSKDSNLMRQQLEQNPGAGNVQAIKPIALACWGMSWEEYEQVRREARPWIRRRGMAA